VKMLAALLLGAEAWYSNKCILTWKVKVTKSKRLLFQLAPSMHRTGEIGSGLLLTPSTIDRGERSPEALKRRIAYRKSIGRNTVPPGSLSEQITTGRIHNLLPTPQARDWKDSYQNQSKLVAMHDKRLSPGVPLVVGAKTGLKLQPAFVEWMMGYPDGWTELPASKLSEMRSSRKSRQK